MTAAAAPSIIHLIPADGIGGVEIAAKSMLPRGDLPCDFRLVFIEPPGSTARSPRAIARLVRAHWRAFREVRAARPDVVLCSLWRTVPVALALKLFVRRTRIAFFLHIPQATHLLDRIATRIGIALADQVWGDSAETLIAQGVADRDSRVISFVIDRADRHEPRFAGPRFISWGRLNRQKGYDRAIRLVAMLAARGIDVRYDIYGPDDGERAALAALIADLGMEERISLGGPIARDALPATARQNSFFLQLSRDEGMCMAAVEAMQFGLVPVATPVGQMRHYVQAGVTGIVADPAALDQTAAQIERLLSHPDAWAALARAAGDHWRRTPLYADDVCQAARALARG